MAMLRKQFPSMEGLYETTVYHTEGFKPIDYHKDFVQPIHVGSDHWGLLTNISLTNDQKKDTVIYYDSNIHFNRGSKGTWDVPPAVEWQAIQLLMASIQNHDLKHINIFTYPSHQQENGHDCGLHVIATMTTLLFGKTQERLFIKVNSENNCWT